MHLGAIGRIRPLTDPSEDAFAFEQSGSRASALAKVGLLAPVALVCVVPFGWVAAEAAGRPEALQLLTDRPLSATLLLVGLLLATLLIAVPARTALAEIGRRRTVCIANDTVTVTEETPFGRQVWSEPLAAYTGLAHHIRASLSGARHEIILVHADRRRSVLLHFDAVVREQDLQAMSTRLGLPVVPARSVYGQG
jgi:hypothetical protein